MLNPRAQSKGIKELVWYVFTFHLSSCNAIVSTPTYWRDGVSLPTDATNHVQKKIRDFLKVRTSYDVLPLSFRLIIFDTALLVKKSLIILTQNGRLIAYIQCDCAVVDCEPPIGIVSAPLWDSKTSSFAGLLTTSDYLNLIQYYWQNPGEVSRIDQFKLNSLRGESDIRFASMVAV